MIDPIRRPKIHELRGETSEYLDVYLTGDNDTFVLSLTTPVEVSNFIKWLMISHYLNEYSIRQFKFINQDGETLVFNEDSIKFRRSDGSIYINNLVSFPHFGDIVRIRSVFERAEEDEEIDISDIVYKY